MTEEKHWITLPAPDAEPSTRFQSPDDQEAPPLARRHRHRQQVSALQAPLGCNLVHRQQRDWHSAVLG